MKYVVLLGDGMADYPIKNLAEKLRCSAPLLLLWIRLPRKALWGLWIRFLQDLLRAADVATLSVLGYDPRETYTGRGPLEAASMGISLGPNDIAYRCNLVTIGEKDSDNAFMDDFTAGHISIGRSQRNYSRYK